MYHCAVLTSRSFGVPILVAHKKTNYVQGVGYKQVEVGGEVKNFTEVKFMVDEDMACTLFKSCQKVSLIA